MLGLEVDDYDQTLWQAIGLGAWIIAEHPDRVLLSSPSGAASLAGPVARRATGWPGSDRAESEHEPAGPGLPGSRPGRVRRRGAVLVTSHRLGAARGSLPEPSPSSPGRRACRSASSCNCWARTVRAAAHLDFACSDPRRAGVAREPGSPGRRIGSALDRDAEPVRWRVLPDRARSGDRRSAPLTPGSSKPCGFMWDVRCGLDAPWRGRQLPHRLQSDGSSGTASCGPRWRAHHVSATRSSPSRSTRASRARDRPHLPSCAQAAQADHSRAPPDRR